MSRDVTMTSHACINHGLRNRSKIFGTSLFFNKLIHFWKDYTSTLAKIKGEKKAIFFIFIFNIGKKFQKFWHLHVGLLYVETTTLISAYNVGS